MSRKIIKATVLQSLQKIAICRLWNNEYPMKLAVTLSDFDVFLASSDNHNHYLITSIDHYIIGWAFTFDRAGDRWFSMIIDSTYHRQGLGQLLLNLMKEKETRLNGWVIDHSNDVKQNGDSYTSPLSFYTRNGFTPVPAIRFEDEKLSAIKIEWHK